MQVTKIMPSDKGTTPAAHKFTQEELQMEFNYMQAERITKKLLDKGIITVDEFNKIMAENQRTFPIILTPILRELT